MEDVEELMSDAEPVDEKQARRPTAIAPTQSAHDGPRTTARPGAPSPSRAPSVDSTSSQVPRLRRHGREADGGRSSPSSGRMHAPLQKTPRPPPTTRGEPSKWKDGEIPAVVFFHPESSAEILASTLESMPVWAAKAWSALSGSVVKLGAGTAKARTVVTGKNKPAANALKELIPLIRSETFHQVARFVPFTRRWAQQREQGASSENPGGRSGQVAPARKSDRAESQPGAPQAHHQQADQSHTHVPGGSGETKARNQPRPQPWATPMQSHNQQASPNKLLTTPMQTAFGPPPPWQMGWAANPWMSMMGPWGWHNMQRPPWMGGQGNPLQPPMQANQMRPMQPSNQSPPQGASLDPPTPPPRERTTPTATRSGRTRRREPASSHSHKRTRRTFVRGGTVTVESDEEDVEQRG